MVKVLCDCGSVVKRDSMESMASLTAISMGTRPVNGWAFGLHVTDPKAYVMRELAIRYGWMYGGGRVAKSTVTMVCPFCVDPLRLDADPIDCQTKP